MFIDKQKLEREHLDEITKIGNLFDTIKVDYCIFGGYALLAHGIRPRQLDGMIVASSTHKLKILEMIFKLNYTVFSVKSGTVKIKKSTRYGDVHFDIVFAVHDDKDLVVAYQGRALKFPSKIFDQERKEVFGTALGKSGKGYFKVASLEDIYLTKLNSEQESEVTDLEMIKASSKLDVEKLLKLLEKNGMI